MAFLAFVVEWAFTHGKLPSTVYMQYLRNPKDFQLLQAYRNYKVGKENEAYKKANKLGEKGKFS